MTDFKHGVTLEECVLECTRNQEYVRNWCKLRDIPPPKHPIEAMIDKASGRNKEIAKLFVADVYETIFKRIPNPPEDL